MIKYRPITDLTDEEVTDLIRRLFSPTSIVSIDRRYTLSGVGISVRFRCPSRIHTDCCRTYDRTPGNPLSALDHS